MMPHDAHKQTQLATLCQHMHPVCSIYCVPEKNIHSSIIGFNDPRTLEEVLASIQADADCHFTILYSRPVTECVIPPAWKVHRHHKAQHLYLIVTDNTIVGDCGLDHSAEQG